LRQENIESSEWEVNGRKKEHHNPVVKDEEKIQSGRKIKKVIRGFQWS